MADDYIITRANGTEITVAANTTLGPTSPNGTSLQLPGRYTTDYGKNISENFLKLLENFSHNEAPSAPSEGQLWYNTGKNQLLVYNGVGQDWVPAGNVFKAATAPTVTNGAISGDLWSDTDNQQLYLFTGASWVLVGPEFSQGLSTGSKPLEILGTDNLTYTVVLLEVQAKPVAIISTKAFTPKAAITGFNNIFPGFNLSSADIEGSGAGKFYGTAEKAEKLISGTDEVSGSNFMRKDAANIANFGLRINNNSGIDLGSSATLNIGVEGQAAIISHKTSGANIDIRVNDQGVTKTVMRIDSTNKVGINNTAPNEALDVTGNVQASGSLRINSTTDTVNISTGSMVTAGGLAVAKTLRVGDDAFIGGDLQTGSISIISSSSEINIGTATERFDNIYANNFRGGNFFGTWVGEITGNATTANRLISPQAISIIGDVSAAAVSFDGTAPVQLTSTISNAFISSKPSTVTTLSTDEILINRVSGPTTGIFKINRSNLFNAVPQIPAGMIMPFAGSVAPTHWLLCDGSSYAKSAYNELWTVIGSAFGATTTTFNVPDLRGRFPLGKDNMGGVGDANRVADPEADTIGQSSGSDTYTIPVDNLPQHTHDLRGSTGIQYHALRDAPASEPEAVNFPLPTGSPTAGSALTTAGEVSSGAIGQPQDVMNPYLTLNYCIYTGQI